MYPNAKFVFYTSFIFTSIDKYGIESGLLALSVFVLGEATPLKSNDVLVVAALKGSIEVVLGVAGRPYKGAVVLGAAATPLNNPVVVVLGGAATPLKNPVVVVLGGVATPLKNPVVCVFVWAGPKLNPLFDTGECPLALLLLDFSCSTSILYFISTEDIHGFLSNVCVCSARVDVKD